MPIQSPNLSEITKDDFEEIAFKVNGLSFQVHNESGRFCNEQIYKNKLHKRCLKSFVSAEKEVPIVLTHKGFTKKLYIDLLINNSVIFELKAVTAINKTHFAQTLDYIFLTKMNYGEIINFRPSSVERQFVITKISNEKRHSFEWLENNIEQISPSGSQLKELLLDLINDWGAFLKPSLYTEAIIFQLEKDIPVTQPINLYDNEEIIGQQNFHILNNQEAFAITSFTDEIDHNNQHLQKLLHMTKLKHLYWLNLNHHELTFTIIS